MQKTLISLVAMFLACVFLCCPAFAEQSPLTALTEEEQSLWYSKYYHDEPASPSEEIQEALSAPLSAEDVITPESISRIYDFTQPFKSGYAVLDSGVSYSAVETVYDGVTLDMYNWYSAWSGAQENQQLIYKIWNPGAHVRQETLNGTMWIQEDLGLGIENIFATGSTSLASLGVDTSNPGVNIIMSMVATSISTLQEGTMNDNPVPSSLIHIFFVNEDGYVVDRVAAYFGGSWVNGKFMVNLNGNEHQMEQRAVSMANHLATEDANLAAIIQEVYAENKDTFDANVSPFGGFGQPDGFDFNQPPEGFDPSSMTGGMPDGASFDPSSIPGGMPDSGSFQFPSN